MFKEEVLFTKEECSRILSYAKEWNNSGIINQNSSDTPYRNSLQSKINKADVESIICPKLSKFNINSLSDEINIIQYNVGDFFSRHTDNDVLEYRKQSIVIQLSEESDYEGGELLINNKSVNKQIGNTIIFDSGLIHEVTKITKGTRYTFVTWITINNKTQGII